MGERGMPVSDSYSFELSVSNLGDLQMRIVNADDLKKYIEQKLNIKM